MGVFYFFLAIFFFYTKAWVLLWVGFLTFFLASKRLLIICGWFLSGIVVCVLHQWMTADQGMPQGRLIAKAIIEGKIVSIPMLTTPEGDKNLIQFATVESHAQRLYENNQESMSAQKNLPSTNNPTIRKNVRTQFQFQLSSLNGKPAKAIIMLSCYNQCPSFDIDERWQFKANLKRVANLQNPGHFDYVAKLSTRHIRWAGSLKATEAICVSAPRSMESFGRFRSYWANQVAQRMPEGPSLGIFNALTLGLTSQLSQNTWDLFRRTGTTHLMIISGAHVGLIAGLGFWMINILWGRLGPLALYYPSSKAASAGGVMVALFYGLVSGMGAPTQRALVAYFVLSLKYFVNRCLTGWQAWRYGLLVVLTWEPHVVLLPGFYLSFTAVALLMLANQRFAYKGWRKTVCLQMVCLLGLMPLTLFWFSYGAINGFLANLIAIPWVCTVILPLALMSLFLMPWIDSGWLFWPVHWVIQLLLKYLTWVDALALFNIEESLLAAWMPISLLTALALMVFLPLRSLRIAVIVCVLLCFFQEYPQIKKGEAKLTILDVGQGLAIVIRTAEHVLVYDTGMKFYGGGDMGKLALIPFLKQLGVKHIDTVVISHPDLDHRGGLSSLEGAFPIKRLIVDSPAFYRRGENCHHSSAWEWEGISFRFLPISAYLKNKNDHSCVLQMTDHKHSVLLTGDIQKPAENDLIRRYGTALHSTVLIVPHHGSKTSSSPPFIEKVAPQFAVISAGFANRYHFPHPHTVQTLKEHGVTTFSTIDCGMIEITLGQPQIHPTSYQLCESLG